MKATGIVRRIDELGRIVIPKEIRRTLRIRESDPMEIFTNHEGGIVLKKYSPIGELGDTAQEYVESVANVAKCTVTALWQRPAVRAAGMPEKISMNPSKNVFKTGAMPFTPTARGKCATSSREKIRNQIRQWRQSYVKEMLLEQSFFYQTIKNRNLESLRRKWPFVALDFLDARWSSSGGIDFHILSKNEQYVKMSVFHGNSSKNS